MSKKDYYEEKIGEIKLLLKTNLKKATDILNEELRMPYIPEKYEVQFNLLKDEITFMTMDSIKNTQLTDEQVIDFLWSDDEIKEATAIEHLSKINLRKHIDEIVKWLNKKGNNKKVARSFIYETLVEQEINVDLIFDGTKVNPVVTKSILDNQEVRIAFAKFEQEVEDEPHLLGSMVNEFKHYLLLMFPKLPTNGNKIAKDFAIAFKDMFDNVGNLSIEQEKIKNIIKS